MTRLAIVAALLLASIAVAAPPPNPDPALSDWYRSLVVPDTGGSCCSISDCRPTDMRIAGDHYEAFVAGAWRPVPPEKLLRRRDNPTGSGVVCARPDGTILCAVPGTEI